MPDIILINTMFYKGRWREHWDKKHLSYVMTGSLSLTWAWVSFQICKMGTNLPKLPASQGTIKLRNYMHGGLVKTPYHKGLLNYNFIVTYLLVCQSLSPLSTSSCQTPLSAYMLQRAGNLPLIDWSTACTLKSGLSVNIWWVVCMNEWIHPPFVPKHKAKNPANHITSARWPYW